MVRSYLTKSPTSVSRLEAENYRRYQFCHRYYKIIFRKKAQCGCEGRWCYTSTDFKKCHTHFAVWMEEKFFADPLSVEEMTIWNRGESFNIHEDEYWMCSCISFLLERTMNCGILTVISWINTGWRSYSCGLEFCLRHYYLPIFLSFLSLPKSLYPIINSWLIA